MRVEIDVTECRGYAICVGIVPEYFELDDEGLARTLSVEIDPHDEQRMREAASTCPTLAIRLAE
jgi:ferredoxin